ncbi:MAG: carboxypeptidase regulatory-like domain-containing protein [Acidobacteria bacterium]|nr:carboxypeptidase regulatory-like domain-containing protein [Acidobacteriota bacterium]
MKIENLLQAFAGCLLLLLAITTASAQVGRIEGEVLKAGTKEPVPNVEVVIERTDIKGSYKPSIDKKGHFLHAGVPYVGTYVILVSAPGFAPTYLSGIRPTGEVLKIEMTPGDGRKLTMDDVKKDQASAPAGRGGGGGGGQPKMSAEEAKKAAEEYAKAKAANEKAAADHEGMKKLFDQGRQLADAKDYTGAITAYSEAARLDAEQSAIWGNLALAHHNRGITSLNESIKDPSKKDSAKQDFTESINAVDKTLAIIEPDISNPAKAAQAKKNKSTYLKMKADSEAFLASRLGMAEAGPASYADYIKAAELSDNPADKTSFAIKGGVALRESGQYDKANYEKAVAAFQDILKSDPDNIEAYYNLGLIFANEEKTWQESANMFQKFVDRAPEADPRFVEAKSIIGALIQGNNIKPPVSEGRREVRGGARKRP